MLRRLRILNTLNLNRFCAFVYRTVNLFWCAVRSVSFGTNGVYEYVYHWSMSLNRIAFPLHFAVTVQVLMVHQHMHQQCTNTKQCHYVISLCR